VRFFFVPGSKCWVALARETWKAEPMIFSKKSCEPGSWKFASDWRANYSWPSLEETARHLLLCRGERLERRNAPRLCEVWTHQCSEVSQGRAAHRVTTRWERLTKSLSRLIFCEPGSWKFSGDDQKIIPNQVSLPPPLPFHSKCSNIIYRQTWQLFLPSTPKGNDPCRKIL
jgi:hypothetical protein